MENNIIDLIIDCIMLEELKKLPEDELLEQLELEIYEFDYDYEGNSRTYN